MAFSLRDALGRQLQHRGTLIRQLAAFVAVGAANFATTFLLYLLLKLLLPYWLAYSISFLASVTFSLLGNAKLVFAHSLTTASVLQFAAVYVTLYLASVGTVVLLVERLQVSASLAPIGALVILLPINFAANRFVFRQR
jgi:putative flippase GtrA